MLQDTIRDTFPAVAPLGRGARRGCALVLGPERAVALEHNLRARELELRLDGARTVRASHAGSDRHTGIALLSGDFAAVAVPAWADAPPELDDPVLSLADPGSGLRVTRGTISCPRLTVRHRSGRARELIEHTAPVPAGAGGGPLLDEHGSVLGINVLRGDAGFVLALAAADVLAAVQRIGDGRQPPRLGVALAPPRLARRMRAAVGLPEREGLLVRDVEEGSRAARAGVRPGDLLVRLGDTDLVSLEALFGALERAGSRELPLLIVRGQEESELSLSLAEGGEEEAGARS